MRTSPRPARWLVPVLLLMVWLGVGGSLGSYSGKLGEVATNDQAAFLPRSAESTRVAQAQGAFRQEESLPAVVVWTADGAAGVTPAETASAQAALAALEGRPWIAGSPSPVVGSRDGRAMQAVVPLDPALGDALPAAVAEIREAGSRVAATTFHVTGPAATRADLSEAFAGIDGLLLGVALAAVLVILLLVYRSVLLPLLIIIGAVFALSLACAIVYALASAGLVRVDGQVQGILSILVIGAATDYALLLTARFREELGHTEQRTEGCDRNERCDRYDRYAAMRAALRQSCGPIVASAGTVALGLLALFLSDLTNNRALGPVGAIGIVCAVASALTFLPAALVLLGRKAYWPAHVTAGTGAAGIWSRIAGLVSGAPRRVWAVALAGLLACAAFAPALHSGGVPLDEIFVNEAPSVTGQKELGRHFPGGAGNPAVVIAAADRQAQVRDRAADTQGVDSAAVRGEKDGRVRIDVVLKDPADSAAAKETVVRLREAVHPVPGAEALVGGYTAQAHDTQKTAERDREVIVPVVLAIILVILVALLRSLVMPLLLVATVALNFFATLGVSALVFRHVFGFSGTDSSVPLYGFVFLVALGVDYNIFLMSRVREESLRHGVREGVIRGLTATGGVITSAGVVLAATFAALAVIPLAFLVQIAFIVAFGVLMDTLVVRSLLVPALVLDIGPAAWWPGRLSRRRPS
ncbi:MMPL family transporter [Streptomyces sp. NPDC048257]|uniref:MMPL family transporter n=1 Tax=Streptomyces sp. NPDC048257 TaxID=3365526 RepID=UPI00370FA11B